MTEPNKEGDDNQPNQHPDNVITNVHKETQNNTQEGEHANNSGHQSHKNPPIHKRVLTFLGNKDNQPLIANLVAIGILVVTSILAWYTYRLYKNASEDSKTARQSAYAANNSAIIAQKTLDTTRKYDSISLVKQQKAIDDNNASSQLAFKRANKSLTFQDSSLKETQKEFEIENRPLIQITHIKLVTFEIGKQVEVDFNVTNFGKQPARIINNKHVLALGRKDVPPNTDILRMVIDTKEQTCISHILQLTPRTIIYSVHDT